MDLSKEKSTNNYQHGKVAFFILIVVLCFALITSVSATDNTSSSEILSSTSSVHNVDSSLTNDEIQKVFDNANRGDTINFTSKSYNNFSVVVTKKLNIVSNSNSVLNTNNVKTSKAKSLGLDNTFGFYFTKSSSGCLLKGFTLKGNADYQIIVDGADNIKIQNNTINGGSKGGVLIKNTTGSSLTGNKITNSLSNGLDLYDTKQTTVKNNNISNNGRDGIYVHNAEKLSITYNDILANGRAGLDLEGTTSNCNYIHNHIKNNLNNIFINSYSNNDVIRENTITGAKLTDYYDDKMDSTGNGILFGNDYGSAGKKIYIGYNTIGFNGFFDAKNSMTQPVFSLDANYYITNDGQQASAHICPMLMGGELSWENIRYLSLGFAKNGNNVYGLLYDQYGRVVTAGDFDMDDVTIDGQSYGQASYVNGKAVINANVKDGSQVTVKTGSRTTTVNLTNTNHNYDDTTTDSSNNDNNNNPSDDSGSTDSGNADNPSNSNNQGTGTGNQTGSGSGNAQGLGSGSNSNLNGTGIMSGESSGVSNGGTGQSGENGAGSSSSSPSGLSSNSGKAYEIAAEKTSAGASAQNRQWIAIAAIVALLLLFVVGYKRRNDDDEFD